MPWEGLAPSVLDVMFESLLTSHFVQVPLVCSSKGEPQQAPADQSQGVRPCGSWVQPHTALT